MSRHRIFIDIEMSEHGVQSKEETLKAIAEGIARTITEDYGIQEYEDGVPVGDGGFDGPFVIAAKTTVVKL